MTAKVRKSELSSSLQSEVVCVCVVDLLILMYVQPDSSGLYVLRTGQSRGSNRKYPIVSYKSVDKERSRPWIARISIL